MQEVYEKIDQLFDENKAKDALIYMTEVLDEAVDNNDSATALAMLNELIGYYRQTSDKENLLRVIQLAIGLATDMGIENSLSYATTLLNAATGYRSIGYFEDAKKCYVKTNELYEKQLPKKDMRYAGLYNNLSLLEQEMHNYDDALELQKMALAISIANNEGFEIAVSYTNLANTYLALENMDEAISCAKLAIAKYDQRGVKDPHYCAALSVLGMVAYKQGDVKTARNYFDVGMQIIDNCIGKNEQYNRMKEYYDMCNEKLGITDDVDNRLDSEHAIVDNLQDINDGMSLCRSFYEAYGRTMITTKFADYENKIAVGLVGPGSDCFGLDDEYSKDHDWGPGFCMWLTDDVYKQIGKQLQEAYEQLPSKYKGYERKETSQGSNRMGVHTIGEFYESMLGCALYDVDDILKIDYSQIEDYQLATSVNGEVFRDDLGIFTNVREILKKGYPERIRYIKIAQSMTRFAQAGQYNYERMWKRGNYISANKMLIDAIYEAMKLYHYCMNVYPLHDKWLYSSLERIDENKQLAPLICKLHSFVGKFTEEEKNNVLALMEDIAVFFAKLLYGQGVISDLETYLAVHADEVFFKAQYVECEFEDLVEQIAKLEFKAFDLVQNEGGRASCQNNWPTFSVMRKSQYLTWNQQMLVQYIYDFAREFSLGHNLITEKYGRMMESTAPDKYEEIKDNFPTLSETKKAIVEQIVSVQMSMMEEFAKVHPKIANNARSLHTYEDNFVNTSYETYLRGEISTYSDKMLQLYGAYIVKHATKGENVARMIIENTAKLYGYDDLDEFERKVIDD